MSLCPESGLQNICQNPQSQTLVKMVRTDFNQQQAVAVGEIVSAGICAEETGRLRGDCGNGGGVVSTAKESRGNEKLEKAGRRG